MHSLRETQRTGLVHKIIGTNPSVTRASTLHTLHRRTASKKAAIAAHHQLHLDTPTTLSSHSDRACTLGHLGKSRPRQPGWYGMVCELILYIHCVPKKRIHNLPPHLSYVSTLPDITQNRKLRHNSVRCSEKNRFWCVSGSEKKPVVCLITGGVSLSGSVETTKVKWQIIYAFNS